MNIKKLSKLKDYQVKIEEMKIVNQALYGKYQFLSIFF